MICVIRVLLGAKLKNYNQIQIMIMLLIFILIETTIGMSCEYIIRLLFRNIVELMDESHRIPYMEQWKMNCKHNESFAFRIEECFDYKKRGNHWLLIKFRTNKDITLRLRIRIRIHVYINEIVKYLFLAWLAYEIIGSVCP